MDNIIYNRCVNSSLQRQRHKSGFCKMLNMSSFKGSSKIDTGPSQIKKFKKTPQIIANKKII